MKRIVVITVILCLLPMLPLQAQPLIEDLIASDGEIDVDPQSRKLFNKAIDHYRQDKLEEALHYGGLAYRKDPNVLLLGDSGMLPAFEDYLNTKVMKNPQDVTSWYQLAKIQALENNITQAVASLGKVIELEPDSELGKKARSLIASAPADNNGAPTQSPSMSQPLSDEEFEKKYKELTAQREQLEAKNETARREAKSRQQQEAAKSEIIAKQQKLIEQMKEQNKTDKLYSTLFWANPTNQWYLNNNYGRPLKGIKSHPEYYKAKAKEAQARRDYYKSFNSGSGTNRPVHLPARR